MRVLTAPVPVASSPREVLDAASPDAVLAVLLHKIVALAGAEGAAEGHALLHDWLVQLATQYNMHMRGHNSATGAEVSRLTFSAGFSALRGAYVCGCLVQWNCSAHTYYRKHMSRPVTSVSSHL